MLIINFSHPLTSDQIAEIEGLAGMTVGDVRDVPVQFDDAQPFGPQAEALAAGAGVSGTGWQTRPVLVVLPGHSSIAAALLAVLHGRQGHFPAVARMARVPGPVTRFRVTEIVNLQALREESRRQGRPEGGSAAEKGRDDVF